MTSSLDSLITELLRSDEERKRQAQERFNKVVTAAFAELPKLNFIRLRGYTPGFNDGEPCVHTQSVLVDNYSPDYLFDSIEDRGDQDVLDRLSSPEEFRYQEYTWKNGEKIMNPLPEDEHSAGIVKVAQLLHSISDDIYVLFDTDWQIDITRDASDENGFRVEREHYDCGY